MSKTGTDLTQAAAYLKAGQLVAIPTETVYGLAANALDEQAVLSIYEAKQRPFFDPLIIHLSSIAHISKYAELTDPRLIKLADAFWPGPLTLLLPKTILVPDLVTSGLPQVAVRIPQHPLTLGLLKALDFPLAAPSANPFGYVSPTEPAHVEKQLGKKVSYILDGGRSSVGIESTIVGTEDDKVCVYRLGGLAIEDLEKVIGKVYLQINHSSDPKAPGQLKNHYAPMKPLYVGDINALIKKFSGKKITVLSFGDSAEVNASVQLNLSEKGDTKEAALNLFRFLREADDNDTELILAEKLPESGLGTAINDRLLRASIRP